MALQRIPDNNLWALNLRTALHLRGIRFGVWEDEPTVGSGPQAVRQYGADFYIAEAEQITPWPEFVANFRAANPSTPAAIITNFTGLTPENVAVIEAHQFACLTECYLPENPQATPVAQDDYARRVLGFPRTQATVGIYSGVGGDWHIEDYIPLLRGLPGWIWLLEYLTTEDWAAINGG